MTVNQNIIPGSVYRLHEFARTAMTQCCALGGYHHRNLRPHCQSQRLMYWHASVPLGLSSLVLVGRQPPSPFILM